MCIRDRFWIDTLGCLATFRRLREIRKVDARVVGASTRISRARHRARGRVAGARATRRAMANDARARVRERAGAGWTRATREVCIHGDTSCSIRRKLFEFSCHAYRAPRRRGLDTGDARVLYSWGYIVFNTQKTIRVFMSRISGRRDAPHALRRRRNHTDRPLSISYTYE